MDWIEETFRHISIAGLLLGLLVKPWDRGRVRSAIRRRGGKVLKLETGPYGFGWRVGPIRAIHEVEYTDKQGRIHTAEVATSLLSGVSFVFDIIMPKPKLLRKNPRNPDAALAAWKSSRHHHPGFPSGLTMDEKRKPRPRLARPGR
ncbi:MAG: hypothetical protein EOP87_00290 [Verrucomicrobiaceae bacterium]|nr:MAG: hypothetical protein EOP87_00290 [Verrucomicrobiaceae bacterium]